MSPAGPEERPSDEGAEHEQPDTTVAPGRVAWVALTPDELAMMAVAARIGIALGTSDALESVERKVAAQARNRFASVRLTGTEVNALGPAFKALVDELRRWGDQPAREDVRRIALEAWPDLEGSADRAAVRQQKVQALRVRIGLQKAWTRG